MSYELVNGSNYYYFKHLTTINMKQIHKIVLLLTVIAIATACGGKLSEVDKKKKQLSEMKEQQTKLTTAIAALEAEVAKLDPSSVVEKAKLVTIDTISKGSFSHFIDLQGKIDAVNISYITPKNGGGQVRAVYVKKGDAVKKGQLLLQLDNTIAKQTLAASQQGLQTLKTQLSFAKTLYQKQKNLWDQNIGTEVQLITAKNNVDNLETQLATSEAQLKIYQEQLNFANIYSDVDGVADDVNVRVGEMFTGVLGNAPQIKIVNTSDLKITVNVPENYLNKVVVGSHIKITLPDIHKTIDAKVTVASSIIDASNRSFYIEAKIPADKDFHPNQVALVNIQDYTNGQAITVPINTLQNDEKGKYVMVALQEGKRIVAKKKMVTIGELYGDKLEIKSGLEVGDAIITEGYQGLYEGLLLTTK
ncbi:efflux RND transporter periplasmic adaptor subunit [Parasediminibacterium sp. JCM 36343]|uniref:efflux RND transporter periplasmic adaptor subunit n=1 Tax=Parasediminibacterium sp. JCM 36343 TaxID=3374279 RepID=UPI003978B03B